MSIEKRILILFLGLVFIISLLIVNSYFPFLIFNQQKDNDNISLPPSGNLTVYILDVGQGDSTLVLSPNGTTMLIDAGKNGKGTGVVLPYLHGLGITELDYIIASHYHADHIGGIDEVINGGVSLTGLAYDRGESYSSQTYNDYVAAVGTKRTTISDGQIIDLGGGAQAKCVAVNGNGVPGASNENDLSVALVINYGNFDYFTAGDLSGETTSSYTDIETSVAPEVGDIEVYRVNHHGSRYSTNQDFVDTIKPEVSVFSVGNDNHYGHPAQEVIDRLVAANSYVYLTEAGSGGSVPPGKGKVVNGHIVITTDGVGDYTVNGDWYATDNTTAQVITITPTENETMPSQVKKYPQPPENATVIPGLKSIPFNLFLDTREITVSKGQSLNVTVTIYFTKKANISLTVGTEDYTPLAPNLTGLPPGIMAYFDQTEVTVQASSEVTVNLTLSIGDQATSGIYRLQVIAIQETFHGYVTVGVHFQLTIP